MHPSRSLGTLSTITVCLLMLVSVWAGYGWLVVHTTASRASVTHLLAGRDAAHSKIAYSETLRTLLRDTADGRAQLSQIGTLSAVDVVDQIRALSSDAGVDTTIDTIAPAALDPSVAKGAPAFAVSLSANGSFVLLYQLVKLLETASLPIMIDQISFEHQGSSATSWTLRARVLIYSENAK